jgi:hypothetical protein
VAFSGTEPTINDLLFDYALRSGSRKGNTMSGFDTAKEWLKEYSGAIIGLLLMAGGTLGLIYSPSEGLRRSFSETAIVAGVVTFTVDPFVKRKLIREASKDIFKHLLGMEFPDSIKDALNNQLLKTENYRDHVEMDAHVQTVGESALLTITARSNVVAAKSCTYRQGIMFEECENGVLLEAGLSGHRESGRDYQKSGADLALTEKQDEPMVWEWNGAEVPLRKGEAVRSHFKYEIRRGQFDHFTANFAAPTVQPTVRVSCSDDLEVTASTGNRKTGNTYSYDKVFLPADHIQIRWRPKQQQQ